MQGVCLCADAASLCAPAHSFCLVQVRVCLLLALLVLALPWQDAILGGFSARMDVLDPSWLLTSHGEHACPVVGKIGL